MGTAIRTPVVDFKQENLSENFEVIAPLVIEHYQEVAHFHDIPLEPDFVLYAKMEKEGMVRFFTARKSNTIIGYAIFFVRTNAHYKSSVQAVQDILFIHPDHRGFGRRFIAWCDQQLQKEGVQAVYHHVKAAHDFSPLLKKLGYELIDYVYGRRLD